MAKIAVTGGAGFIGSNMAKALLNRGDSVSIIDNFSGGFAENLADLGIKTECKKGDLSDYKFAKESLKEAETVYHFAAEVGNVVYLHGSKARELAALQANLAIDTNVFKACMENSVKRIIYASSVAVYPFDEQQGSTHWFKEEDTERKVNPEGGYGWSKYMGEKQLSMMPDVQIGVARIFHAYGPNIYIRPERSQVIASLMRKAIMYPKEQFIVWGDGTQRRCFVYIDDAIDALIKLEGYVSTKGNLTVNIGSNSETSVSELANLIVGLSGKEISIKFDNTKPTGVLSRMSDLSRIERTLGWKPTTDIKSGLTKTYEWASKRLLK